MPKDWCKHIPVVDSKGSLRGDEYEAANGQTLPNLGARRCEAMTLGSRFSKDIVFQVADIHKPLLSTAKAADAGYDSFYTKDGGYMINRDDGHRIPIIRMEPLSIYQDVASSKH